MILDPEVRKHSPPAPRGEAEVALGSGVLDLVPREIMLDRMGRSAGAERVPGGAIVYIGFGGEGVRWTLRVLFTTARPGWVGC